MTGWVKQKIWRERKVIDDVAGSEAGEIGLDVFFLHRPDGLGFWLCVLVEVELKHSELKFEWGG